MRGGAKAPLPLVTRGLRTLVPDWHWLRVCLLGPSVQNQASRWHFCSVLMLAVKRSPPWRQKAAGPGLSRGAAASAPRPGPLRRATPRPGCPAAFLPPFAGPSPGLARMRVPAPHREGRSPGPPPSTCCVWPPRGPPCFQPRGAPRSLPCAGTAGGEEACALALFWRGRPSVRERGWPLCPTRPERSRWPRPENRGLRGCFRKNGGFPLRWMGPRQWVLTLRVPSRLDVPLRVWHARIMMGPWPPSVP